MQAQQAYEQQVVSLTRSVTTLEENLRQAEDDKSVLRADYTAARENAAQLESLKEQLQRKLNAIQLEKEQVRTSCVACAGFSAVTVEHSFQNRGIISVFLPPNGSLSIIIVRISTCEHDPPLSCSMAFVAVALWMKIILLVNFLLNFQVLVALWKIILCHCRLTCLALTLNSSWCHNVLEFSELESFRFSLFLVIICCP